MKYKYETDFTSNCGSSYGGLKKGMITVLLISIFIVMLVWKMIYRKLWQKELFVKFAFEQPYVYAGESVQLDEIIENRKRMPVAPLEVRFRVKKGLLFQEIKNNYVSDYVYKRDIYALMGARRITRRLLILCKKRGIYTIEDVSLFAYSLMLDQTYHKESQTDAQLYVYAKRTNVEDILKASVNTFTSVKNERIMIYLDVEDNGTLKKEGVKEESISVAASLYEKLLNKGVEVGICINLYDEKKEKIFYLPPSCNKSHRMELEQILATQWNEDFESDFEKALEIAPSDAIPVIISKNISPHRIQLGENLCGNITKGIWVIPHEPGEIPSVHSDSFLFIKREVYE